MTTRAIVTFLLVLLLVAPARAETPEDKAASVTLFKEGKAFMKKGKYVEACAKFEASLALVPGVGTRLNLGDCLERLGKTASAWAVYRDAEMAAADRASAEYKLREAKKRTARLEARLSRLTVTLAPGADVAGLEVERDGTRMQQVVLGNAIPLDPGEHVVAARAPGRQPWQQRVEVQDRATVTVEIPALEPAEAPPPVRVPEPVSVPEPAPAAAPIPAPVPLPAPSPTDGRGRRLAGLMTGGAGLVAVGVGVAFGLSAKAKRDDAYAGHCNDQSVCDPAGFALLEDARGAATISTVGFGVGLAAIATGVLLYVTAPSERPVVAPAVAAHGVGVAIAGVF
jgi:serine/threonine-protein kinase